MDATSLIRRRLQRQRLTSAPLRTAAEVVAMFGGMQAQEYAEARWSLAERMRGEVTAADIGDAFNRGEILRTHTLRPTWHFVARDDIRMVLAATSHRVHSASRYVYTQFDITEEVVERAEETMVTLLSDGEARTRPELTAALGDAGIEAGGTKLGYLVMTAELDGLICSGPLRGKQHTYALVADRAPDAPGYSREEAQVELARRYFGGHGPASRRDFCMWASLPRAEADPAIEALGDELVITVDPDLGELIEPAGRIPRRTREPGEAFLIPMYDEMGMGYRDVRPTISDPDSAIGHFERPVVIDGVTVGSWRRKQTTKRLTVEVTPVGGRLDAARTRAIEATAERLGRHLDLAADVSFA